MKRAHCISLVAAGGIAAVVGFWSFRTPEPVYAGKRVSEWLDAGAEPAAMAVHEVGPQATPWILHKVRWEHPRWGQWEIYQHYYRRFPRLIRPVLPRPRVAGYDEFKATAVLVEVGPAVVPQLTAGLQDGNPGVRITSAMALGALQNRRPGRPIPVEALRAGLRDANPEVREEIRRVIAAGESPPPP